MDKKELKKHKKAIKADRKEELTSSTIIFRTLKTTPEQKEVTRDEVIDVLAKLLSGIMEYERVESMVSTFAEAKGITSEIAYFNEAEFKDIINRLLDEWIEVLDTDHDGSVSKKEFYYNVSQVYGWQAWLIKRNINRTFEHILEVADMDGNETLSKEEIKLFLRKFATGELDLKSVIDFPKVIPKGLYLPG